MRRLASLVVITVMLGGCTYRPTRSVAYDPIPVAVTKPPARVVAVRALRERRPPRRYPVMTRRMLWTYVPLVPFVRIPYERLDETDGIHRRSVGLLWSDEESFTRLLMNAVAEDLRRSGLFAEVRVVGREAVAPDVDYILDGWLDSTAFSVSVSSYGLGLAGVLLWYLPIPMNRQRADVRMQLVLRDRRGTPLWQDRLVGESSRLHTVYAPGASISNPYVLEILRYGANDEGVDENSIWAYHASAIRSGMRGIKRSLAEWLDESPPEVPPAATRDEPASTIIPP